MSANYKPMDIVNYIYENELEMDVLMALMANKKNFSIGEITDKRIEKRNDNYYLVSKSYSLDMQITDDDVLTAAMNGLYISAFVSRKDNDFSLHYLVHHYPEHMKPQFEEEIAEEVIDYILRGTVVALKLDSPKKVQAYLQ